MNAFRYPDRASLTMTGFQTINDLAGSDPQARRERARQIIGRYYNFLVEGITAYMVPRRASSREQLRNEAREGVHDFWISAPENESMWKKFDPKQGRLKSYIKTCCLNHVKDIKRGERAKKKEKPNEDLDEFREGSLRVPPRFPEDELSELLLARDDLKTAWQMLKDRARKNGSIENVFVFRDYKLCGDASCTVGERYGLTQRQVSDQAMAVLRNFKRCLEESIADRTASAQEYQSEWYAVAQAFRHWFAFRNDDGGTKLTFTITMQDI